MKKILSLLFAVVIFFFFVSISFQKSLAADTGSACGSTHPCCVIDSWGDIPGTMIAGRTYTFGIPSFETDLVNGLIHYQSETIDSRVQILLIENENDTFSLSIDTPGTYTFGAYVEDYSTGQEVTCDKTTTVKVVAACSVSSCPQICDGSCNLYAPACNGTVCCGQPNCAGSLIESNSGQCNNVPWNGKPLHCPTGGDTKPTAPTLGTASCTDTTATLNWTGGTGGTINAYYCDQTKAGSAACTADQPSLPAAQHFLLINGGNNSSPLTVPNLVAGDEYKWLVASYGSSSHANSVTIGDFTCTNAGTPICSEKISSSTTINYNLCGNTDLLNGGDPNTLYHCPAAGASPDYSHSCSHGCSQGNPATGWCNNEVLCNPGSGAGDWCPGDGIGGGVLTYTSDNNTLYTCSGASGYSTASVKTICGIGNHCVISRGGDYCENLNGTPVSLVVGLDGVGITGDHVKKTTGLDPTKDTITAPLAALKTRNVKVEVLDSAGTSKGTGTGIIIYQDNGANKGLFTGTINISPVVTPGNYTVKVTVQEHLTDTLAAQAIAVTGTTITIPNAEAGDVVGSANDTADNHLMLSDYIVVASCAGFNLPGKITCADALKTKADLNLDGNVDEFDYNLFLREYQARKDGD